MPIITKGFPSVFVLSTDRLLRSSLAEVVSRFVPEKFSSLSKSLSSSLDSSSFAAGSESDASAKTEKAYISFLLLFISVVFSVKI